MSDSQSELREPLEVEFDCSGGDYITFMENETAGGFALYWIKVIDTPEPEPEPPEPEPEPEPPEPAQNQNPNQN